MPPRLVSQKVLSSGAFVMPYFALHLRKLKSDQVQNQSKAFNIHCVHSNFQSVEYNFHAIPW